MRLVGGGAAKGDVWERKRGVNLVDDWGGLVRCSEIYFFFQAEDGIRDHCVTGVQTCALPISGTPTFYSDFTQTSEGRVFTVSASL